jgi:hypothetical protein
VPGRGVITVESSESPESYEAALLAAGWEIIGDDPGFGNGGWVVRQIDSPLMAAKTPTSSARGSDRSS